MTGQTIDDVVLDHVAHAVPRWQNVWRRYATDLGAEWSSGGLAGGFAPGQVEFGNGARLELLMPNDTETNDFLARFIAKSGPGPHHLTFKVPDLGLAIERARAAGYDPIGIDFSDPEWMEAFIHPKQAPGIVVQLAQAPAPWSGPAPDDYPTERRALRAGTGTARPASLLRATHVVEDFGSAGALFVDLLGGVATAEEIRGGVRQMDVSWGGPLTLRIVAPVGPDRSTPLHQWLGGRNGRIHHLEFSAAEADGLPGALPRAGSPLDLTDASERNGTGDGDASRPASFWVIPPAENAGLRLVVRAE